MEFKQLQSFIAVAKYRSFTKAAEYLYISQPTISTHIRMLEEELNTRLIIRTTKSIEITPQGIELYECANNILSLRDNLIKRWEDNYNKTIYLGASSIPSCYILPEILPSFKKKCSDVQFVIHQSDSQGVLKGLVEGRYEIGLVGMNTHEESISYIPFLQDNMVLITPENDFFINLKKQNSITLEQIITQPIILREQGSGSKKCMASYFEKQGISENELQVTARLNDQESIKRLVAGGLGISIISEKASQTFQNNERFLTFPLPNAKAVRNLYIVHRKNDMLNNYTWTFIDFIRDFYKRQ